MLEPTNKLSREAGGDPASTLTAQLPLYCNVEDETLYANIRRTIAAGYPIIKLEEAHDRIAVIVGGGPSIDECREELMAAHESGAHIFALNGAGKWLEAHGSIPHTLIILDARAHNARFVEGLSTWTRMLLASQCDPSVFQAAHGHEIITWHPEMEGTSGIVEPRKTVLIGRGTSVGMRALELLFVLGYRTMHLYGYDSSYRGKDAHAYPQVENDSEYLREVTCGGKKFWAPAWMIRQADDFQWICRSLMAQGVDMHVHGDGLLPEVAKQMPQMPVAVTLDTITNYSGNTSRVIYDLGKCPASWDFLKVLVAAEMGRRMTCSPQALRFGFRSGPNGGFRNEIGGLPPHNSQAMFDHVVRPALSLIGAFEDDSVLNGGAIEYDGYSMRPIVEASRAGADVPRFRIPLGYRTAVDRWLRRGAHAVWSEDGQMRVRLSPPEDRGVVTITLREAAHWPHRNSNVEEWKRFAIDLWRRGFRVIFVRDTAHAAESLGEFEICPPASTDLLFRAALYDRAKCNLFVTNGPATLGIFGVRPWLMFRPLNMPGDPAYNPAAPWWWKEYVGIGPGEHFPWSSEAQRIAWDVDSYPVIRAAWDEIEGVVERKQ
jgi:hypothetical protein